MNTFTFVKTKQKEWAKRKGIELQGSKKERGEKVYTRELANNLFQGISETTKKEISSGDGNEFGNGVNPGKMQALHSSSALGVNVFEYWKTNKRFSIIAKALQISTVGIRNIVFERKFEILKDSQKHPNIDVVFEYEGDKVMGIECKYTEPFQSRVNQNGLKEKYINDFEFWNEFPSLKKIAQRISPKDKDNEFKYLHCAQLIKHVLGMYSKSKSKDKFGLFYLYQPAFFENNEKYGEEISNLTKALDEDGVKVKWLTWQELLARLIQNHGKEDQFYIEYLTERYL